MENNSKITNVNNVSQDNANPPPYDEINDEFGTYKKTVSAFVPLAPSTLTALPQPVSTSITTSATSFAGDQRTGASSNFESDFFQKPPKFLLYPSTSIPEDGTKEDSEKEFGKFSDPPDRSTGKNESKTPIQAPHVFSAQTTIPQNTTRGGVTMSVPQLEQAANIPVQQSFITDSYLPRHSLRMVCPNCKASVNSVVQYVSGQLTHLVALVACWFTCCLACVPYFIDDLKDAEHFCPQCRAILGYNRKKVF